MVLGVLSIVSGIIYGIFMTQMRTKTWQDQLLDMEQECRNSMDVMVADLLRADALVNSPGICDTTVQFRVKEGTLDQLVAYSSAGTANSPAPLFRQVDAARPLPWPSGSRNGSPRSRRPRGLAGC